MSWLQLRCWLCGKIEHADLGTLVFLGWRLIPIDDQHSVPECGDHRIRPDGRLMSE